MWHRAKGTRKDSEHYLPLSRSAADAGPSMRAQARKSGGAWVFDFGGDEERGSESVIPVPVSYLDEAGLVVCGSVLATGGEMEAAISQPQAQEQVAAALLIIQMVVVISVFVGAVVSGYWSDHRRVFAPQLDRGIFSSGIMDFAFLLLWIFLSFIPILLTPFFKIGWDALGFNFSIIEVRQATKIAFSSNIFFCSWFIFRSGGWSVSPFVSVLGALPVFAILIGEPIARSITYVILIVLVMAGSLFGSVYMGEDYPAPRGRLRHAGATWLLASAMLFLTTFLGYIRSLPHG